MDTGVDDDWREVDRRPAELRTTMAKLNGKGKEKATKSNGMPDGGEDLMGLTKSTVRFLFLYFSRPFSI